MEARNNATMLESVLAGIDAQIADLERLILEKERWEIREEKREDTLAEEGTYEAAAGGVGHDTIYGSLGADNIYDEDDVVIDYSSSNAAVAIGIDSNRYYMRGAGGYAQGDMISLASYSAKNEWLLTPFADTLETLYNNTTVHAGAGNDNITMGTLGTIVYGEDGYDIIAVGL
eukprot:gene55617-76222_t